MKSFLTMAIVFLMAGVFAPAFSFVSAQTPQPSSIVTKNGNIITKSDGWQIPDVSELEKNEPRFKLKSDKYSVDLYLTSYKTANVELPRMNYDGTADAERKIRIKRLTVYDIDERVFCYRMLSWNIPLKGEAGVGVVFYTTYYDLDGDGKFEIWDIGDSLQKSLIMPDWAIKKAESR